MTLGSSLARPTKRKTKRTKARRKRPPQPQPLRRQPRPLKPRAATPPAAAVTVRQVATVAQAATAARRRLPPIPRPRPRPTPLRTSRRKASSDNKAPEQHVRCSGASLFRQIPQDAATAPATGPIGQQALACKKGADLRQRPRQLPIATIGTAAVPLLPYL